MLVVTAEAVDELYVSCYDCKETIGLKRTSVTDKELTEIKAEHVCKKQQV
jgi:hypothetical protein